MLTPDELETLRNVDSKKIKIAGEDFLNQLSPNRKKIPEAVTQYIEKLNKIVEKIEGGTEKPVIQTLETFVSGLSKNAPEVAKDTGKATQNTLGMLKPLKVFQNTRIALSQLSVWVLAVAIIPPLCNAIIGPIMKNFGQKKEDLADKKQLSSQPVESKPEIQPYNTTFMKKSEAFASFQGTYTNYSTGMRV